MCRQVALRVLFLFRIVQFRHRCAVPKAASHNFDGAARFGGRKLEAYLL